MAQTDAQRRRQEWTRASDVLDRERRARLRSMTQEQARETAEQLLDLVDELPRKAGGSGLVTQQRLFRRVGR